MLQLRPYQQQSVDSVFEWFEGDGHSANPLIVLPTGTGKSLVLSEICRRSIAEYGEMKIVVVTHVMELIKQNHEEMMRQWPEADAGIYSAGIGKRQHTPTVVFCGIQSVHSKAHLFQKVDFVIVDEAHLIPRKVNTMYQKFLNSLRVANPKMRIIGLTATPYRMDSGMLHRGDGALFDDVCYDYSVLDAIKEGYLCNLITKNTRLELDTSGVHTRGGEFIQAELQEAVDEEGINRRAVEEMIEWGQDRNHWLVFGSGVEHCRHLSEMLNEEGVNCRTIFGDTPKDERAETIAAFKRGEIRALCSMGVLTTGFNAPQVDMIAVLRPTKSPGLYVQIVGRGMRIAEDKANCLILDFARNIQRHGPVDQARVKNKDHREKTEPSDGPLVKNCPQCRSVLHLSCMQCPDCGYEFPREIQIVSKASELPVLSSGSLTHWVDVDSVQYTTHRKAGKPDSLKVTYGCGFLKYSEWVCLEHFGFAAEKAKAWWLRRSGSMKSPVSIVEAIVRKHELRKPSSIQIKRNGKFDEIMQYKFDVSHMSSGESRLSI